MAKKNRENLSFVGENIRKIRQVKKLSQAEFSQLFSLARASVGAYEEGRSEPKIETLISIANYFGISIDALLTRKLTVNEILKFNSLNEKLNKAHRLDDPSNLKHLSVRMVHANEYLDYAINHQDHKYLSDLDLTGSSVVSPKPDLAFEMSGSEMFAGNQGIRHGDILFAKQFEKDELDTMVNKIIVVVFESALIIRRLTNSSLGSIVLSADDSHFQERSFHVDQVKQLFKVIGIASQYIPTPNQTEVRLAKIEAELRRLKQ